jgi:hypothetical protein
MTSFIAVDGEGVTYDSPTGETMVDETTGASVPVEYHDYVMLSVGSQTLHKNGDRLTFHDIMPFLYRQHQLNPTSAFVGFYLSYDFSQWLRDISEDAAWMLLHPDGIAKRQRHNHPQRGPFPVRFDGWEFDLLDSKRFRLRPANAGTEPWKPENVWSWMTICDAGPFFQSSFLTAVSPKNWPDSPVCTEAEYEIIKAGKRNRTDAGFDETMLEYNVMENVVLARTMTVLDTEFRKQGWKLRKQQWFGPGQAVNAWLRQIQAPLREDIEAVTPKDVLTAAQASYFGGRFEITRHGHVPGSVWEYDINSAYPYAIRDLPCLLHGEWRRSDTGGPLCIMNVSTTGTDQFLGGLPHRNRDGVISYPRNLTGWYWRHEVNAAYRAGLIDAVDVHDSWSYYPCNCPKPFESIETLYEHRLSVGKNTAAGKSDKLIYNSAYGKQAQSVGNPMYANAINASLITSRCRSMILDAIATHPRKSSDVVMIATDGIYFRSKHPTLQISDTVLGAWDVTKRQGMTLFMPGVYWDDVTRASLNSENVKIKSRGINASDLAKHIGRIDNEFHARFTHWPTLRIPIRFNVVSPTLAIHRGKWEMCGAVSTHGSKMLSSDPVNKRDPKPYHIGSQLVTRPHDDAGTNYPYQKEFGHKNLFNADDIITDDGYLDMELIEHLRAKDV